jgi:colanic acid/amylovoran biosynthesis glycosyltransferase
MKMKIACFVSRFPLLSETFILNQITGLIDRGHEVDIYAQRRSNEPKIHEDVKKYHLMRRTSYYGETGGEMPANKIIRFLKGFFLFASHFHKNPGALLKSLNVFKFKRAAANLSILYTIIPFVGKGDYDVVHCHFGPNGNLGALLKDIGVFTGKVTTVFHGHDMTNYVLTHGKDVYDYLFRNGDLFLPVSERWKNELISWGCREDKIKVHRMGIDTGRYVRAGRRDRGNWKVNIVSVARLVEKKGIQYGIEAVGRVIGKYPDIEYRIIGDGRMRDELESVVARLNLGEKVKLVGWKNQDEILECMKDSDIMLAPSVTGNNGDQEGIPVVLMEAMAMGLPVLSTCHSGIPELVEEGVAGFLVPERDVEALSGRLADLLEHPELWSKMGNAGRKHVEKYYDIDRLNDRLILMYEQLRGSRPKTSFAEIASS